LKTKVVKVDPEIVEEGMLEPAVEALRKGGLVAFPTETVYGLGALISREDGIRKIFEVKERPADNPLIVHVDSIDGFLDLVEDPPEEIIRLVKRFWPGPFTVVWWKKPVVPDAVTAGLPKVAVRSPAHPVALKLIELSGEAIAAPSANRSGKPSPTKPEHVIADLHGLVDVIIDAGETLHGVESTVVDFTTSPPRLLRPGALPVEEIEKALGKKIDIPAFARGLGEAQVALSPGTRYKHYAPEAELVVVETSDYRDRLSELVDAVKDLVKKATSKYRKVAVICSSETCSEYRNLGVEALVIDIGPRSNMFMVAKNLFATLRRLDEQGIEYAVVEGFEERGLGLTVMNRLRKASGGRIVRI